jgi:hypothetical protein
MHESSCSQTSKEPYEYRLLTKLSDLKRALRIQTQRGLQTSKEPYKYSQHARELSNLSSQTSKEHYEYAKEPYE